MINYRELYSQAYGITWDKDLEIHHIDGDRENNDLSNLVLLPSDLHHWLHESMLHINACALIVKPNTKGLLDDMLFSVLKYGVSYSMDVMGDFVHVLSKCRRWGFLKSVNYRMCDGSPIGHITKDTMKWIG